MGAPRFGTVLVVMAVLFGLSTLVLRPDGASDARAGGVLRVDLAEWSATPQSKTVRAGRVTFEAVNRGRLDHELLVLRSDRAPGALPIGLQGPALTLKGDRLVLGTPHAHQAGTFSSGLRGSARHVRPGASRRDTVTLTRGDYILLCALPGHYQAGQRAALRVV